MDFNYFWASPISKFVFGSINGNCADWTADLKQQNQKNYR